MIPVPNTHIVTQNLYYSYYSAKTPKNLTIVHLDPHRVRACNHQGSGEAADAVRQMWFASNMMEPEEGAWKGFLWPKQTAKLELNAGAVK